MLELVGEFYKTRGGRFYKQGFENHPKIYPNPLQKHNQPTQKPKMAQPVDGYVPLETKKKWTKETNLEKLGLGEKIIEMGVKSGNGTGDGDGRRRGGAIMMRWWIWVVGFEDLRGLVYGV
jgi:hypothetical protein